MYSVQSCTHGMRTLCIGIDACIYNVHVLLDFSAYDNCRSSDNFRSISASVRAISYLSGHRDRVILACVARTHTARARTYVRIGQEVLE